MKTQSLVIVLVLAVVAGTSFGRSLPAQPAAFPSDLVQITSDQVPRSCDSVYSMAYWPGWPPLPPCFAQVQGYTLYYSPSMSAVFLDDRLVVGAAMMESSEPDWTPWALGGGGTNSYDPGVPLEPLNDWASSNGLYLTISFYTNSDIPVTLHHATAGSIYEFLSSQSLTNPLANWASEGIWMAAAADLPVSIQRGTRTNQLFFQAHLWPGTFDHGSPRSDRLFVQADTNVIYAVINGATNPVSPVYSNWFALEGPLYQVNLGYGANDAGFTNAWIQPFPAQGIKQLVGFSTTCSNLCLCMNPIESTLDVSGWPALQDLECWQCRNANGLWHVNFTNCPNLARVCVEDCNVWWSLDFTGCPKLGDVRSALNENMHGLIFNAASKANVWHLCIRGDSGFDYPKDYDLTGFPQMRQLWMWSGGFTHDLNYPAAGTPTKLESVQAANNAIPYADFTGQTNLQLVEIYDGGTLTNVNITGCSRLGLAYFNSEHLNQGAVDHILTNLVLTGITSGDDLTNTAGDHLNPQAWTQGNTNPSPAGLAAAVTLSNRGWTVYYDLPPVAPNTNCVTGTAPIWFTNTSQTLRMHILVATNYDAVTWYLGDGSKVCGTLEINTAVPVGSSNCVVVDPPSALLAFGVAGPNCGGGSPTTKLSSVWGLTNYPSLQQLYLYGTDLSYVSLARCTNLTAIALTGTSPSSTNVISAWFTDLLDAQRNTVINSNKWFGCLNTDGGYFYYPATPGLNSDATTALTNLHYRIGWNFWHP